VGDSVRDNITQKFNQIISGVAIILKHYLPNIFVVALKIHLIKSSGYVPPARENKKVSEFGCGNHRRKRRSRMSNQSMLILWFKPL
jgi:hypothetical protein